MTTIFTKEQCEILEYARSGHNILITGQAGTGKSTIVNAIREDCKQRGLKVALVCSSGIACHVYERGIAFKTALISKPSCGGLDSSDCRFSI